MMTRINTTILVGVLLTAVAAAAQGPRSDQDAIQGTWICTYMERNGRPVSPEQYKDGTLVMDGDRFTYKLAGRVVAEGIRKLDPSRSPKAFDDTHTGGSLAGKTYLGIYELDGDTFKTCNGSRGQARPSKFATSFGSGLLLAVYKRSSPGANRPEAKGSDRPRDHR